LADTGIS